MRFVCVECGREVAELHNRLCVECYVKNSRFTEVAKRLHLVVCPKCRAVKYKNSWREEVFEDAIKRVVESSLFVSSELTEKSVSISCKARGRSIYLCDVTVTGLLKGVNVNEKHSVEVVIDKELCQRCSRKAGHYFEAILQVRADRRVPTDKELQMIIDEVKENVESLQRQGKQVFITEILPVRGGVDLYMSDKGFTQKMMQMLHHKFGGSVKTTAKQSGIKNGKQQYRMTYLLRLPYYRKGDFLAQGERLFYLKAVERGKPQLVDLEDWSEISMEPKMMDSLTTVGDSTLVKETVVVSQSEYEVQVLDPYTFLTVDVRKPRQMKLGKTVRIVKWKDRIYIFPYEDL
ncbi:MAG TPA: hypothetical protein ENI42_01935 [Thermoplasmatales archaeon]|nr:hypothetical protein [Thermoplasmatales archaeon]